MDDGRISSVRGIVLAAGGSSRMGRPKAALATPHGPTFAQDVVDSLLAAGVSEVVVVAGAHDDAVRGALAASARVRVLHHRGWAAGQLSSLLAGLDAVDHPGVEAVVVTLVDVPGVRPATVATLLETWRATRAPIVRPAFGDRNGHPVVFDRATFAALRAAPVALGAKAVVRAYADRIVNVLTDDTAVLRDVDTPAEYRALRADPSAVSD